MRSHVRQEVGDECAGHDDGLSLIGDNGGKIASGLRRIYWERRRGAVMKGSLGRDQVHRSVAVVEAVECGGQHQIAGCSGFRPTVRTPATTPQLEHQAR
ncbi:hypothetical protein ACIQVA_38585 [Streptomyces microflavus]|uniref:hypothetical protein n=1 Tax=Streptomyces microflavus TaxID=1919 RepID=UPI00380D4E32